ncbi:hypothetical protein niasHT_022392 [Heterodera trifolii]|uniref:Uncharacterized protein n=1 Tax=Heterodera trifolii TaxID=157864 RepID=A0ABD2KPA7_9BILA
MEEITDGNGDDQSDNFISQLRAMLSKVKMAKIGQKGDLFGTDFENQSEEKEKPTKSHENGLKMNFDRDLAEWHQQNLKKMLAQSTRIIGKGKLSEYFDPQKAKWENELTFRLRQFATLGDEKQADERMKLALARMLEIVGGMPSLFGTLSIIYFEFTSQLDVLNWLLRSYFDFLFAASKLATRKALLSIDLLVFLKSIDRLVRQKGVGREFGWNSFRMELAQFFDHIQLVGRESDIFSIELECIVKLLLLHRLEKELEGMPKVREGWTVSAFLNVPDQNQGKTLDTKIEQMRHRLEGENAEQFEKFVDTKKELRIGLKRLSGVQLVRRLLALFGHSQMSKIGKLIRKSRNLEAIPEWYLDTKHFKVDVCANFENGKIVDTYRDTEGIELVKMYEGFLKDSKLFLSIHAKGASKESLFGEETAEIKNENLKIVKKAALWLIDNFVDEFLAYLDNFFEFGGNQKEKDRILNEIWQKWVETNAKMQKLKEQRQLFCHIYVFSMFFLSTIWQRLGEKERKKMAKVMAEKRWDQITIFALRLYDKSSSLFGSRSSAAFATCDYSQWDELLHHRNAQLVHSLTLFRLIKRFKGFAHFLCQMIQKDTVETKDRILLLFRSVAEFDWLEKQFPMILRIEELNFRCRLHFYEQMFKFKSSSDLHRYSEFRMAFSVLFKQLSVRLTAKSAKLAHPMLTEVMFVVHEDIFREIGTCVGICRLMLLLKGIECRQNEVENDGESRQFEISTEQLEQCVKSGAKLEQFGTFWETIRKNHIEFLMGSKGNAFPLLIAASSVVDTALGAKARIGKIVGDKAYKAFWDKGLSAFVETQTFDKEVVLIDHYLIALLIGETEISRMTNKLAADLSVFVHWSDSEPKGAKMDKFWQKKRTIEMHRMHDGLFDVELEVEMTKIALAFEETIKGMKGFLAANRNVGIEKKLAEEWDKMAKKADKETERRTDEMPKRTNWNNLMDTTPKWLKELHAAKFKKYADKRLGRETENAFFVHPGEILINGLKKGLESCYIEVKRRLGWFMEEEQMKELLEKLEIPFEREQIEEKRERIEEKRERIEEKRE